MWEKLYDSKKDPVKMYREYGFAIVELFDEKQANLVESFAKKWIYRLLNPWVGGKEGEMPLETYHLWSKTLQVDHNNTFRAHNRHICPSSEVKNALINEKLTTFFENIGLAKFDIWDEGLGWLAFRLIRPGVGDGYPFSRKNWGPAKNVVSAWIPIVGFSEMETLALLPGSHLKEYRKYLPENDKFIKDEYRLLDKPHDSEAFRPNLNKGEVVFYHPKTIHSEDVRDSNITRLNLEVRFDPHMSD